MQGKTHKLGGIAAASILATQSVESINKIPFTELSSKLEITNNLAGITTVTLALMGAVIVSSSILGCYFPDFDHKNSTISNRVKPVRWIIGFTNKVAKFLRLSAIETMTGQRGLLHWIFAYIALYIALAMPILALPVGTLRDILTLANLGFLYGVISHLFLDFLTKDGIPLFFKARIKLPFTPIKSSSLFFGIVIDVLLIAFIASRFGLLDPVLKLIN